jgi:hypothetical protein
MSLSKNFRFVEKDVDAVAFAIERVGGRVFRMDGRSMDKWTEIEDPDACHKICWRGSEISESEAMLMADELEADIAAIQGKG